MHYHRHLEPVLIQPLPSMTRRSLAKTLTCCGAHLPALLFILGFWLADRPCGPTAQRGSDSQAHYVLLWRLVGCNMLHHNGRVADSCNLKPNNRSASKKAVVLAQIQPL